MTKKTEKNIIAGLDIGTSKIAAFIAEVTPVGTLEMIGIGSHPSRGLKRGVVVDIEATVQSIQRAVQEAELMAGCEVRSVYTGIAGSRIRCGESGGDSRRSKNITYFASRIYYRQSREYS